jgi:LTXXQ motif family protein
VQLARNKPRLDRLPEPHIVCNQQVDTRQTELKITDEQLPLWNAFAQAMRDDASTMQAKPHAMMGMNKAATLSDKLAERETMLTARIEAVRKLKAAADPLYAALNADQKKTADEIMLGPMGMMM